MDQFAGSRLSALLLLASLLSIHVSARDIHVLREAPLRLTPKATPGVIGLPAEVSRGADEAAARAAPRDPRNFANGVFGNFKYSDQFYCVQAPARPALSWLCILTIGQTEGAKDETVVSIYTEDGGATWSSPLRLEDAHVPVCYGVPILLSSGRVVAFYNMNIHNVTRFPDGRPFPYRNDEMGSFVIRWTDDFGRSWSGQRGEVPYRMTPVDANNAFHGAVRYMWNVDKPSVLGGVVTLAFTKIGTYPQNPPEEVFLLRSADLDTAADPAAATWQLLPEGPHGIRNPRSYQGWCEEGHQVALAAPGHWLVLFRTADGYLGSATSRDDGHSFGASRWAQYCPVGEVEHKLLKHPQGSLTPRRMDVNGRYLLLYYNNGQQWHGSYRNRNPYWLAAGREVPTHPRGEGPPGAPLVNTTVCWSQPEIAIYDPDQDEYLEGAGGYADYLTNPFDAADVNVTLTNKTAAAVVRVPPALLRQLYGQISARPPRGAPAAGLALDLASAGCPRTAGPDCLLSAGPVLPDFGVNNGTALTRQGLTAELWLAPVLQLAPEGSVPPAAEAGAQPGGLPALDVLVSAGARGAAGNSSEPCRGRACGLVLGTDRNGTVVAVLSDGREGENNTFVFAMDEECSERVRRTRGGGLAHHVALVMDGGPRIALWVVDGVVCDGGPPQRQGWAWWPLQLGDLMQGQRQGTASSPPTHSGAESAAASGGSTLFALPKHRFVRFRYYTRALYVSEVIAAFRAGPGDETTGRSQLV